MRGVGLARIVLPASRGTELEPVAKRRKRVLRCNSHGLVVHAMSRELREKMLRTDRTDSEAAKHKHAFEDDTSNASECTLVAIGLEICIKRPQQTALQRRWCDTAECPARAFALRVHKHVKGRPTLARLSATVFRAPELRMHPWCHCRTARGRRSEASTQVLQSSRHLPTCRAP